MIELSMLTCFFKWKCAGPFFSGVGASMQMRCLDVVHAYFNCGLSKALLMYKCHWHTLGSNRPSTFIESHPRCAESKAVL